MVYFQHEQGRSIGIEATKYESTQDKFTAKYHQQKYRRRFPTALYAAHI